MAPNDTTLYVDNTAVLSCVVYGLPLPVVSWQRDNLPVRDPFHLVESEVVIGSVTFVRSTLQLCSLRLPDDGRYACIATNNITTAEETFTINVNSNEHFVYKSIQCDTFVYFSFQLNHKL